MRWLIMIMEKIRIEGSKPRMDTPYRRLRLIFASLCFLVGMVFPSVFETAHSAELHQLYEAAVPIADESESERNRAMKAALLKVLIRLSGQRKLASRTGMARILQHPERHVQQFRYRSERKATSDKSVSPASRLVFRVRFDSVSVNRLLREANIQTWGQFRPSILVWLVVEGGEGRVLLGAADASGLSDVLYASATERGASVILPLLDLDDRFLINETDVWNRVRERILKASERYATDTILVGRAFPSHSHWQGHWEIRDDEMTDNWKTHADGIEGVLRKGLHGAIDILVARYARSEEESADDVAYDAVELTVLGIKTIGDYARVERYLNNLQSGIKVYVTEADVDRMSFRVLVSGGQTRFDRMIGHGATLAKMDSHSTPMYQLLP
uniref:DUF2066 domain-containing protein n=1 Tax=Candidatus Kentrum sp. TC TaxID=2126339 RepID=A0A450ZZT0_9GAMM|nr:MAG: hypothetical protein BECKTC1821F_GA0114240_103118 [Candidatus Kentron sp. TC]